MSTNNATPDAGGDPEPLAAGVTYLPVNVVHRTDGAQSLGHDVRADHPIDGVVLITADPTRRVIYYDVRTPDAQHIHKTFTDWPGSPDLLQPADIGALYVAHGHIGLALLEQLPSPADFYDQEQTYRGAVRALTAALHD